MPDGLGSHEKHSVKITLITWEGEQRIDHTFYAVMPRGALLERLQLGVLFDAERKESVLLSLPFGMKGSHYVAPCNNPDHYVIDDA